MISQPNYPVADLKTVRFVLQINWGLTPGVLQILKSVAWSAVMAGGKKKGQTTVPWKAQVV